MSLSRPSCSTRCHQRGVLDCTYFLLFLIGSASDDSASNMRDDDEEPSESIPIPPTVVAGTPDEQQSSLSRPTAVPAPLPPPTRKASMRRTTLRRTMRREKGGALAASADSANNHSKTPPRVSIGNVNPAPLLDDKKAKVGSETPPGAAAQSVKKPPRRPSGPRPKSTPYPVPQYDSTDSESESSPAPPRAPVVVPVIPPPKRMPSMRRSRKSSHAGVVPRKASRAGMASRKSSRAGMASRKSSRAGVATRKSSRAGSHQHLMSSLKPSPLLPMTPEVGGTDAVGGGNRSKSPMSDAESTPLQKATPTPPPRVASPRLAERMAFFERKSTDR